ncbi:hypothetical protein ACC827_26560 [Rhizobium ruizarguesonis]
MTKNKDSRTGCNSQSLFIMGAPGDAERLDRALFARNPKRLFQARWTTEAELGILPTGVARRLPGCRMATAVRSLPDSGLLVYEHGLIAAADDPASLGDDQAEALFEYFMGRVRGAA